MKASHFDFDSCNIFGPDFNVLSKLINVNQIKLSVPYNSISALELFTKLKPRETDDYYFGVILTVTVRVHRCRR